MQGAWRELPPASGRPPVMEARRSNAPSVDRLPGTAPDAADRFTKASESQVAVMGGKSTVDSRRCMSSSYCWTCW